MQQLPGCHSQEAFGCGERGPDARVRFLDVVTPKAGATDDVHGARAIKKQVQDRRAPGSQSQPEGPRPLWLRGVGLPPPSTRFCARLGGPIAGGCLLSVRDPRTTRPCSHQGSSSSPQVWRPDAKGSSRGPTRAPLGLGLSDSICLAPAQPGGKNGSPAAGRGGAGTGPARPRPGPPLGGEANPSAHEPSAGGPGRRGEHRASQVEAQVFKGRK